MNEITIILRTDDDVVFENLKLFQAVLSAVASGKVGIGFEAERKPELDDEPF